MTAFPEPSAISAALSSDYADLRVLANQGAQGVVLRGRSTRTNHEVALKIYSRDHVEERSEREVSALRKLVTPQLVELHDAGTITIGAGDYRYLATTFIEGDTLSNTIKTHALSFSEIAIIAADIACAIRDLWSLRIVHRDIKPANIIVRPDGHAVLIDLGLARHLDQKTLTQFGYILGTPGYFAPETLSGQPPTCKADVFALGIVVQEMLIRRHPTHGAQKLLVAGGPDTFKLRPDVPNPLGTMINQMVARSPLIRPQPRALAEHLKAAAV